MAGLCEGGNEPPGSLKAKVHCVSTDGSHRRADIVAIDRKRERGLILDPTVRMEQHIEQATQVSDEKEAIYRPCIPHLSESYNISIHAWKGMGDDDDDDGDDDDYDDEGKRETR
ncbi:hypothetical protein ANN_23275 [Periplaneta americana]|uniref:Uncharacterized protein n=1 Tax=Periplaneta americana TaxID=6978 RepID=A0ABQ8SM38_PERAM|nr:hypothetical protein ANN_23275 [Periplaneta americana]